MGWRVDSDIQQMLRESARGHLADSGGPAHLRQVRAADQGFDGAAWLAMAELGWTGILLPEALGGSALGMEPALTLAEELGRALSPEPFVSGAVIAATLLAASGTPRAAALAQATATGTGLVTLAWQERSGQIGAEPFAARLAAGRLAGRKLHVPCWSGGAALLVVASGEHGDTVIAVDPSAPGVSFASRRMTDGTLEADVAFADVAVSGEDVLLAGEAASAAIALALARGTVALSAQLEGLASALWSVTADFIRQRTQFGQPLADFQALRHRMVDLYAEIELAGASWRAAAAALDRGETQCVEIHAAKARCSQAANAMGRWAIQYHGAFGYTDEADVGLYVNAALRWGSWLGNAGDHRRRALAAWRKGEKGRG